MYQRNICPTVGLLRRSLIADVSSVVNGSSRAFSVSVRRAEEQSSNAPPSAPEAPANPNSRKVRSAAALDQITRLQARRNPSSTPTQEGARPAGSLRITRRPVDGPVPGAARGGVPTAARGGAPTGPMVRAPAQLRLGKAAPGKGPRGPNLRGRDRKPGGSGDGGRDKLKRRQNKAGGGEKQTAAADVKPEETLSDGMVQHLLRLQRKEWDRVPYEPKYAIGSFAANELIHAGRELFKGESPPVKIWGPLEKRIGVVGMFGAEAHLKVRRVLDGDAAPFGQEELSDDAPVEEAPKAKTEKVVQ